MCPSFSIRQIFYYEKEPFFLEKYDEGFKQKLEELAQIPKRQVHSIIARNWQEGKMPGKTFVFDREVG